MGARVNTAIWMESSQRWRIDVQKDGVRRSFYSSKPGRNGQREANRKADAWLDDGIQDQRMKVGTAYLKFLEGKRQTTSRSNWAPMMSRWNNHISSVIARKQVSALTEQDLQDVLDRAYARSKLSRKTLICLRADLCSFLKYCRNIPVCTPYELRHTFVSIAKVLPAGLVKSLVGHSEDMDTFGVYGHELNGDAQQQANALNSIFSRLLAHG